jgi:hypothetical protein
VTVMGVNNILVEPIGIKGCQLTCLVVIWRDPQRQHGAVLSKYLCVDGMHRARATCKLILDGHERWPGSMRDPTGQVVMQCAVLHKPPSRKVVLKHALLRNAITASVVKTA